MNVFELNGHLEKLFFKCFRKNKVELTITKLQIKKHVKIVPLRAIIYATASSLHSMRSLGNLLDLSCVLWREIIFLGIFLVIELQKAQGAGFYYNFKTILTIEVQLATNYICRIPYPDHATTSLTNY